LYMKTNTLRNLMVLGVTALPVAAMAAEPTGLGFGATYSYSTTAGVQSVVYDDTALVTAGWTVGANPIVDDGFLQVTLTSPGGDTYFQTIIGGGGAQGNDLRNQVGEEFFDTESFVKVGATGGTGIAVSQIVDDWRGGNNGTLTSDSIIYTGADFHNAATEASVHLTQDVTDSTTGDPSVAGFSTDFAFNGWLFDLEDDGNRNDIVGQLYLSQDIDSLDAVTPTLANDWNEDGVVNADDDLNGDGNQDAADGPFTRSFVDSFKFGSISTQLDSENLATVQSSTLDIKTLVNLGIALTDQDFRYMKRVGEDAAIGTTAAAYGGDMLTDDGLTFKDGVQAAGGGTFTNPATFGAAESVDWVQGDTVDMVQIAQSVDNAGDFGFASLADRANLGGGDNDAIGTPDEYQSLYSLANAGLPAPTFDPASTDPDPFD